MTALNIDNPEEIKKAEEALKESAKSGTATDVSGEDNGWTDLKYAKLREQSELFYNATVKEIVNISNTNLNTLRNDKLQLREKFVSFIQDMLIIQIVFLLIMLLTNAMLITKISDNVLIGFMTSVFVETIGCMLMMIKFAFKSDEELKIIETLNSVVKTFQKFRDDLDGDNKK